MADAYRGLANYRAAKTSGSMRLMASVGAVDIYCGGFATTSIHGQPSYLSAVWRIWA